MQVPSILVYNIHMREKNDNVRTQIYLTTVESDFLKEFSKSKGITKSELIRRILDEWIEERKKIL